MQYCNWAEMVANGMHTDSDKPINSMFKRAGDGSVTKPKASSLDMVQAFTEAAGQVSSAAFSPPPKAQLGSASNSTATFTSESFNISQVEIIDNCFKCYKQLHEVHNLKTQGFITDEEYAIEQKATMEVLKKLEM